MRRWCAASILCALFSGHPSGTSGGVAVGLSHVPIAVQDLARAASDFERLGFALKEGRPHDDGIRNRHVKFRDGTEVELITAPQATDDLTRHYREFLEEGDGAAFLSLYAESMDDAEGRMRSAGLPIRRSGGYLDFPYEDPLGYVFFAGLNQSPTDRPEHFAHANTAFTLEGVWLQGDKFDAEDRLLHALGLKRGPCDDPAVSASCVALSNHQWLRFSTSASPRRIVGLTLRVRSVAAAAGQFGRDGIPYRRVSGRGWSGALVEGAMAHGVRLEFRQHQQEDVHP